MNILKKIKTILIVMAVLTPLVSCNGKKEFKDEDYKQQQADYEKKKAELNKASGKFYKANKQKLTELAKILVQLKDTTKPNLKISKDTSFFKSDVLMKSINFRVGSFENTLRADKQNIAEATALFIHRLHQENPVDYFSDPIKELVTCYDSGNDFPCMKMKDEDIQTLLNLKYAFVVDDIIKVDPKLKMSNEFESGLYLGSITCYDISNQKIIYTFSVVAQNSESISSFEGGLESAIKIDFNKNIGSAIEKACLKHFLFQGES